MYYIVKIICMDLKNMLVYVINYFFNFFKTYVVLTSLLFKI